MSSDQVPARAGRRSASSSRPDRMKVAVAATVLAVVTVVGGCSSGSSGSSAGGKASPSTTQGQGDVFIPSGRGTLSTGGDDSGSRPSTTVGQGLPADPLTYAKSMFAAWRDANQLEAARYGDQPSVTSLFAKTYSKSDAWTGPTCQASKGISTCTWSAKDGSKLTIKLRNEGLGDEKAVTEATFSRT